MAAAFLNLAEIVIVADIGRDTAPGVYVGGKWVGWLLASEFAEQRAPTGRLTIEVPTRSIRHAPTKPDVG